MSSVGDAVHYRVSVAPSGLCAASMTTVEGATSAHEMVIHNIYAPATCSIEVWESAATGAAVVSATTTADILVDQNVSGGFRNLRMHATASSWFKIKNTSSFSTYIGYDGMVTK